MIYVFPARTRSKLMARVMWPLVFAQTFILHPRNGLKYAARWACAALLVPCVLTGCTSAELAADAPTLIATATQLLANYRATPTPSPAVVAEAQQLLAAAEAANATYGATSSQALAAASALTAYLATSAPGNGVTPSTVPTAG